MGIYQRPDSPYYWMLLERPGQKATRRSTGIPVEAPTVDERREYFALAHEMYLRTMNQASRIEDLPIVIDVSLLLYLINTGDAEHLRRLLTIILHKVRLGEPLHITQQGVIMASAPALASHTQRTDFEEINELELLNQDKGSA